MAFGHTKWKFGGVEYPLTSSTANSLLEDADPALYYAIELFSSVIETYAGPRLLAQAAREGLNFPSAVEKTIHFEPTPFLLSDQLVFPLFCLYRSEETWDQHTVSFEKSVSTWEWAYVLPPLTPRQIEQLSPILRTVAVTISSFALHSFDQGYEAGATLRDLSGIQKMVPGPTRYGEFEPADEMKSWWRAVTGKLFVQERLDVVPDALATFDGVNINLDVANKGQATVEDVVQLETKPAPVIETIAPATGSKSGSLPFTITGRNFRIGTRPLVLIGGSYASNVVVTHATTLTGLTPEGDATPTHAADVQVIAADGQESNVLEAAYTFTTP